VVEGMVGRFTWGVVRGKGAQQVPPLRYAPVGVTKGSVVTHPIIRALDGEIR